MPKFLWIPGYLLFPPAGRCGVLAYFSRVLFAWTYLSSCIGHLCMTGTYIRRAEGPPISPPERGAIVILGMPDSMSATDCSPRCRYTSGCLSINAFRYSSSVLSLKEMASSGQIWPQSVQPTHRASSILATPRPPLENKAAAS